MGQNLVDGDQWRHRGGRHHIARLNQDRSGLAVHPASGYGVKSRLSRAVSRIAKSFGDLVQAAWASSWSWGEIAFCAISLW